MCNFLFDFNRNYASILYRFWIIASYLSTVANFNLLHLQLVPALNFAEIFGIRKLEYLDYHVALLLWYCVIQFAEMYQSFHDEFMPISHLLHEVNVILAMIASLPGARLFCAVWAVLVSLQVHLTCRCLCVVHSMPWVVVTCSFQMTLGRTCQWNWY